PGRRPTLDRVLPVLVRHHSAPTGHVDGDRPARAARRFRRSRTGTGRRGSVAARPVVGGPGGGRPGGGGERTPRPPVVRPRPVVPPPQPGPTRAARPGRALVRPHLVGSGPVPRPAGPPPFVPQ